ncbi:Aminopeptidase S [Luteitalea pratensis]|uniref:Aminopeptidase S n=1 Tax=Luteitalea pratensis TaxID=1855912 RepID=A0A143PS19_LUTPR|nr:M20/M25/M40 family metallo-hydrolase [Luteitalea pratensis]AMY11415.1 Aminopeptidase S [Luteitalea pratensis]
MTRPFCLLATATLVLVLTGGPIAPVARLRAEQAPRAEKPSPGVEPITEAQLRNYLAFIAADALEGRQAPSRGLDAAAAFLASHMARLGLRPAGDDGTYLQSIALTQRRVDVDKTSLAVGKRTLDYGDDFLPGQVPGTAEGPVVYIGNGTVIRSRGVDPYKDMDVTGKIVVSNTGLPAGLTPADLKGPSGDDWESTELAARRRGAVAVLFLPDYGTLERWPGRRDALRARTSLTVDAFAQSDARTLPTATLSARGVGALFTGRQLSAQETFQRAVRREPAAPFALPAEIVVRLSVATTDDHPTTSNVVAILEGSDPVLKHEYVAIGAHYDHLGTAPKPDAAGDTVYNGADDDGSGTVSVLSMAEAFATSRVRPKRSILFVWHTGEEEGLWGSRYFTDHPTVPLDHIVAQLNIDMIGRSTAAGEPRATTPLPLTDPDTVYVVGSKRLSADLAGIVEQVNERGHGLHLDYSLDDPSDPARIYERSDHYQYAKHGIPIAFFFTGVHGDYHGLDDEIDRIDFVKMRRIAQFVYGTARALAERPARPKVDGARAATPATP